jgi:hypothetical protein
MVSLVFRSLRCLLGLQGSVNWLMIGGQLALETQNVRAAKADDGAKEHACVLGREIRAMEAQIFGGVADRAGVGLRGDAGELVEFFRHVVHRSTTTRGQSLLVDAISSA